LKRESASGMTLHTHTHAASAKNMRGDILAKGMRTLKNPGEPRQGRCRHSGSASQSRIRLFIEQSSLVNRAEMHRRRCCVKKKRKSRRWRRAKHPRAECKIKESLCGSHRSFQQIPELMKKLGKPIAILDRP